jgi:exodeoxyribonuclease V alpha subunit
MMLERNLIYTALTRARKLAIFVGDKKALTKAIQNQTSKTRQTKLLERLRGIQ